MSIDPRHARGAFIGLLMATCALPSLAAAADKAAAPKGNVDELVVTSQKTVVKSVAAVEALEYGNSVQSISSEDIRLSGASNFAELAQFLVKGVNIGYSPDEGEYTIRLDGGGDRDTLVIRDGVPLYDRGPALEDIWGATTLDPHMIENVEVFRGGNSLFYGSNGGIGVVSIVSKKPNGVRKGEFGASYGSFNSRELWGNFTLPLDSEGKHSLMAYGSEQATDGPRIFDPNLFVDNVKAAGGVQTYALNRNEVGLKYLWQIDADTKLRLGAEYTESWFQDPFPDGEVHSPNTVRFPIIDGLIEHRWSPAIMTEVQGYYSNPKIWNTELYPDICKVKTGCTNPSTNLKVNFGDYSGLAYANGPYRGFGTTNSFKAGFKEIGMTVRNTVDISQYLQFVAGAQYLRYQDDSDERFPVTNTPDTTTGVFVDLRPKLPFSPDTAISLAVREDFLSSKSNKTIWKFGVRQPLIAGSYVRANGGTSYSLPKITELNTDNSTTIGNPNLKPEQTTTYNGGVGITRQVGMVGVSLEVGGFKTEITDRITGTTNFPVPATAIYGPRNTLYNNPALNRVTGATADLDVAVGQQWKLSLGYTHQDSYLTSGVLKGEQNGETPVWFIDGTINWTAESKRFSVSLLPRFQGPEWARGGLNVGGIGQLRKNFGNYAVVNGSLNYFAGDKLQHQFQIRLVNIFNRKYAERWGYGNQRFGSAFNRGEYGTNDPRYYFGYPFEGKPFSVFVSYSTKF